MILESLICFIVLFFISVLFYKQANEQFEILQLDAERLEELPTLYADKSPIVLSGFPAPSLGTMMELQKRPHILQMKLTPTQTLGQVLTNPMTLRTFSFTPTTAEFLAKESGLTIWFEHHLYKDILPSPYTKVFFSSQTYLWPHHRGLFQTSAFQTILMPTQGEVIVSLLLPKMIPYMPRVWKGRQFHTLTQNDTPLLSQIQYLDVVLRKGNLLCLPSHLLVDISTYSKEEPAWIFQANLHHPISRLTSFANECV